MHVHGQRTSHASLCFVLVPTPAGVHVDIPVLTPKDVEDLQQFCVRNQMDFVAASFVQVWFCMHELAIASMMHAVHMLIYRMA